MKKSFLFLLSMILLVCPLFSAPAETASPAQTGETDSAALLQTLQQAADLGDTDAMYRLGMMYYHATDGASRDDDKAYALFLRAAELGNPDAMYKLGDIHTFGRGVMVDGVRTYDADYGESWYQKALSLYEQAALAGDTDAMRKTGDMYLYGLGTERNREKAKEWFLKAAELGSAKAMTRLGDSYKDHIKWNEDMEEAYRLALEWYRKAADAGDPEALYQIGEMYENGYGVEEDFDQAHLYYLKAAQAGCTDACNYLGHLYEGEGVPDKKHASGGKMDAESGAGWPFLRHVPSGLLLLQYHRLWSPAGS